MLNRRMAAGRVVKAVRRAQRERPRAVPTSPPATPLPPLEPAPRMVGDQPSEACWALVARSLEAEGEERKALVLSVMAACPEVSAKRVATWVNLPARTVARWRQPLVEAGVVFKLQRNGRPVIS